MHFLTLKKNKLFHKKKTVSVHFSYLFDFVLDGEFDTAEAGAIVRAWWAQIHVAVQYGLNLLRVPTKVQHTHYKVFTLHGQLTVVVLQERTQKNRVEN